MNIKTTVYDVASYILREKKVVTAMKLQKLVYYCQAWSLVWDEKPMFNQKIEAWANGPVSPDLYRVHRGEYDISTLREGDSEKLDFTQEETVDAVLSYYGDKSSQWLSDLTHMEDPWKEARKGIPDGHRGQKEITHASMAEYYEGLPDDSEEPDH